MWISLIAAVPPTLAVILATRQQNRQAEKVANTVIGNTEELKTKVDEVHVLTNDRLSKALAEINDLKLVVDRLKRS